MDSQILYNGKRFPEYVFNNRSLTYLFFEFDLIFYEEFWNPFKTFLEEIKIDTIVIENIDPVYLFKKEINVRELPNSFLQAVNTATLEGYFPCKASLHMITDLSLIYPVAGKDLFCLVLQRGYDLAILGLPNSKHTEIFNGLLIRDLVDYLTISFGGQDVPEHFKDILNSNWNIS
jgi:hypothetical protein